MYFKKKIKYKNKEKDNDIHTINFLCSSNKIGMFEI